MPRVHHKIRSHHAFSATKTESSWKLPATVRPELMSSEKRLEREADLARLNELIAAFRNPAATAERAVDAGIESATGDQQKIEDTNRKLKKELSNPLYAASYFAAQRLARNKVLRSRRV